MSTLSPELASATSEDTALLPQATAQAGDVSSTSVPPTDQINPVPASSSPESPAGPSTARTAPAATVNRPVQFGISKEHLEQEVTQVMGTLSSWWGGVKKQSASALTSLKADLDKTVIQAQADFEQLKTAKVEVVRKDPETFAAEQEAEKERKLERQAARAAEGLPDNDITAASILDRLTTSTSQLQNTLQSTYQSTLAATASNPAIANATDFTKQLANNLHLQSARENIQLSLQQAEKLAEEYVQRGDKLRKDAEHWVKEAVKVVPPAEGDRGGPALSWDGSDWYAIATQSVSGISSSMSGAATGTGSSGRSAPPGRPIAASRKDALLGRLREDPELVLVDPQSESTPPEQQQRFEKWLAEKWPQAKEEAVETEAGMAGAVRMATVPEHLTDEQFWQRYLYIRDTIIEEDERRQQLLKATEQTQNDDFTWDDEADDDPAVRTPPTKAADDVRLAEVPTPKSQPVATMPTEAETKGAANVMSAATSPRDSEESYDVVSDQTKRSDASSAAQPASTALKAGTDGRGSKTDEDEDSDWE